MIYKIVNTALRFIIKRYILLFLNLVTLIFCLYSLKGMWGFIHFLSDMKESEIEQINDMLNNIAGVFVAIGVLMEERQTIQHLAKAKTMQCDEYLNLVAHHNGMGLLLIGLFMELISLMIDSPKSIVNVHGAEIYLYVLGFIFILFAALVQIDFIKDYVKTYFRHVEVEDKHG